MEAGGLVPSKSLARGPLSILYRRGNEESSFVQGGERTEDLAYHTLARMTVL